MMGYKTFSEYLEHRDAGVRSAAGSPSLPDYDGSSAADEPARRDDAACPGVIDAIGRNRGHVSERSMFRGVFKSVNPARPASPTNSRLLASPFRRQLKSQVIGR
jgi:hypothetical protein